jgi:tetratricopeptide (TPR) repeat protein
MNPMSRRRVARRRLVAEWAARANRLAGGDAAAVHAAYPAVNPVVASGPAGESPARRLPFELLDAPAMALVGPLPSNGNGDGSMNKHGVEPEAAVEAAPVSTPVEPPPAVEIQAAEASPEEHLYQAARHAAEERDTLRAVQLYRHLLTRDPANLRARNNLALVLDDQGEHDEALEHLDRCRRQEPQNLEVLINRSAVLGALGRYAEAEHDLQAVLSREPTNAEALFNLGVVTSRRGRWREGVAYLHRAIEIDGSRAAAHFYLGEALNHVDDLPGALQAYQRSVELKPGNPKALYGMGIVLDRMNRPEDAAPLYRRSRELQGK